MALLLIVYLSHQSVLGENMKERGLSEAIQQFSLDILCIHLFIHMLGVLKVLIIQTTR